MVDRKNTKVALFSCLPPGTKIMSGISDREPSPVGSQRVEKGEPTQLISDEEFLSRFDLKGTNLRYHERLQLQELLIRFKDVFSDTDKVGHYTGECLSINVSNDAKPVRKSPYSVHPRHEPALRKELEMMQRENIIRESRSAWSSPAIVIPKPGRPGDIRLLVDYKEVNKLIEKDSHPLPRMDRCLDQVGRSRPRFMTSLDLEKGFFQMELDEDSKRYTSFSVPHNLFEFNRLPMGLSTRPAQFLRCMNHTFRDYINQFMVIYLDDLLLYSKTFEEHLEVLSLVFSRLRQANLKLMAAKTQLARSELKFLGFRVSSEGIKADTRICEDVQNFPRPTTVKQTRSLLGLAQFYKRFIRNFAKIAKPLNDLLKKGIQFEWTEKCEEAFGALKEALTNPPVLTHPNMDKPYRLYTDASDYAVGYVLCQDDESGREKVIAYGGKSLQKYQLSYGVTEKEMLAAYSGALNFDHYLRHNSFELITDHSALQSLFNKQVEDINNDVVDELRESTVDSGYADGELRTEQYNDPGLKEILNYLERQLLPDDDQRARKVILTALDYYTDEHKVLHHRGMSNSGKQASQRRYEQLVVPKSMRGRILKEYHDGIQGGHFGIDKTLSSILTKYYWETVNRDVSEYVQTCQGCQSHKRDTNLRRPTLGTTPEPEVLELITLDIGRK